MRGSGLRKRPASALTSSTSVAEALLSAENAEELPASVSKMLCAMLPYSLEVPPTERADFQNQIVCLIGETLKNIETKLLRKVAQADGMTEQIEAELSKWATMCENAQALVDTSKKTVAAEKSSLAESMVEFKKARRDWLLNESRPALDKADVKVTLAKINKYENVLKNTYIPLKEGLRDETIVQNKLAALTPVLSEFDMDASMVISALSTLSKQPNARSTSDFTVLLHLEREMSAHIQNLKTYLSGEQAKKEKAARTECAVAAREAAKQCQQGHTTRLIELQAEQQKSQTALKGAMKTKQRFVVHLQTSKDVSKKAQAQLVEFREGPLTVFEELVAVPGQANNVDKTIPNVSNEQ